MFLRSQRRREAIFFPLPYTLQTLAGTTRFIRFWLFFPMFGLGRLILCWTEAWKNFHISTQFSSLVILANKSYTASVWSSRVVSFGRRNCIQVIDLPLSGPMFQLSVYDSIPTCWTYFLGHRTSCNLPALTLGLGTPHKHPAIPRPVGSCLLRARSTQSTIPSSPSTRTCTQVSLYSAALGHERPTSSESLVPFLSLLLLLLASLIF